MAAAILTKALGQLTAPALYQRACPRVTNDVETTLTIRLPEQRCPRIATIPNEHGAHEWASGLESARTLLPADSGWRAVLFLPRILEV